MPKVKVNGINMNYEQAGGGEPLILIPFLSGDQACYAFQVPEYSKHFTCISVDTRGAGESDKPAGPYSTGQYADDIVGLMHALGIEKAHIAGVSLGAATALQIGAKYPDKVKSLSVHSGWTKSDLLLRTVIESWELAAKAMGSVAEMAIKFVLPWCLTQEIYTANPDFIKVVSDFIRSRPKQPVEAFINQCEAVKSHDCESKLGQIKTSTLITFGYYDRITSPTSFADKIKNGIKNSELMIFEGCAHTPMYEKTEEFNQKTLDFLRRHAG